MIQIQIYLPFFHLQVQTLGQMVLKALEAASRRATRTNTISCIFSPIFFLPGSFFSTFNFWLSQADQLHPARHHFEFWLSLFSSEQSDHPLVKHSLLHRSSTSDINHYSSSAKKPSLSSLQEITITFLLCLSHLILTDDDQLLNQSQSFLLLFRINSERWEILIKMFKMFTFTFTFTFTLTVIISSRDSLMMFSCCSIDLIILPPFFGWCFLCYSDIWKTRNIFKLI